MRLALLADIPSLDDPLIASARYQWAQSREGGAMALDTTEQLRYLTQPLIAVARHHLEPNERVVTAIYVEHSDRLITRHVLGLTQNVQVRLPTRGFILTEQRALILDDPTDPATTTADRGYLAASCALDRIIAFEMRSHLLDCALTLVMAEARGAERITIEYNGTVEDLFLAAVAWMREVIDGKPPPSHARVDEVYVRARAAALAKWRPLLAGLELKQENAVARYLIAGESVQDVLAIPVIDQTTWWQRWSLAVREHPPGVLVRTDRQLLLVKETIRIVRGSPRYGSDAWLMPLRHVRSACLVTGERLPELQVDMECEGIINTLRLPLPPELAERALMLARPRPERDHHE
jgi:hypothetical protein